MKAAIDWEHLPFGLIEELKAKNLYHFVIPEESTCNCITIEVYKNEKFRALAGDWGSIIGVHIFPSIDRRPLTNERGSKYIGCSLHEIEPLNGFKWVDEWKVVPVENLTDEEGYQYAYNWKNLGHGKIMKILPDKLCWVRRQKLRRVMVVDLQSARSLPYELAFHFSTTSNSPNTVLSVHQSYFVELLIDSNVEESGIIATPTFTKDLTHPLTYLARYHQIEIQISKTSSGSQAPVRKLLSLGDIIDELDRINTQSLIDSSTVLQPYSLVLLQDKSMTTKVDIRINENTILNVVNTDQFFAEGQVNEIVLSGSKISQRLKGKIIMLSLDLQCNFNGLLKDITILKLDSQTFITDFDLINILDDINQIQSSNTSARNELGKVMSYLREAETAKQELFYLYYPTSMPLFTKWITFQHFSGEQDLGGMNKELIQRILHNYSYMKKWFSSQPVCSPPVLKHYHLEWQREIGALSQFIYRIYLFKHFDEDEDYIDQTTTSPSYGILWSSIYDYYHCLRYLSCIKYNIVPEEGAVTQLNAIVIIEGRSFQNGLILFDFHEEHVEVTVQDLNVVEDEMDRLLFPVRLPFESIEAVEISHAHSLTMSHLLEAKLLSVTSFQIAANSAAFEHEGRIDIDTLDGQHYGVDFKISQESMSGSNQPATASLHDTVRVLIPHWIAQPSLLKDPNQGSDFVHLTMEARPVSVSKTSNSFLLPSTGKKGSTRSRVSGSSGGVSPQRVHRETNEAGAGLSTLSINKEPLRLGYAQLPLQHNNALISEQELQLHLKKTAIDICIDLKQIRWVEERVAAAGHEIYALCFLAGREMQVVNAQDNAMPPSPTHEKSGQTTPARSSSILGFSRKPSRRASSAGASSNGGAVVVSSKSRSGYIHRTAPISAEEAYAFDHEVFVLDIQIFPALDLAHYLLLEVWGMADGGDGGDILIGEALIPLHLAQCCQDNEISIKQFVIRSPLGQSMSGVFMPVSTDLPASSKHLFTLGTVDMKLYVKPDRDSPTPLRTVRHRGTHVNVSLTMRPLQPSDCAWPAQILTEQGLESDVYYFSVLSHGLQLCIDLSKNNMTISDRVAVLEECEERMSNASDRTLQLLIPYMNMSAADVFIISEHTLMIHITLHRLFTSAQKIIKRPLELSFVIGPCLAEDMYGCVCNNINVQEIRCNLMNHFTYVGKEQEESFNSLTNQLESALYETNMKIEEFKQEQLLLQQFDPSNFGAEQSNDLATLQTESVSFSKDSSSTSMELAIEYDSRLFLLNSLVNKNVNAKILYLKIATVRIYLWYLLELTPGQFMAEKYRLEASWIPFDEHTFSIDEEPDNGSISGYTMEIETVVFKILQQMKQLENEIRYTIYRGYKNNYMDSSASLTKLIYHKYRAIIAFLLETLDTSVRVSESPLITNHKSISDQKKIKKNTNTINPQKKRDLIKFIITHDEIVENYTNYILQAHNYKFTKRPLLSLCINVDDLLKTFSGILEGSLLSWNTRIVKHFLSEHLNSNTVKTTSNANQKSTSSIYTPWEITTIYDKSIEKELYISNIPETIQLQLNVEIGLKKIALEESNKTLTHTTRSVESDLRIERMNNIIKQSIILSYIYLAAEYEHILGQYMASTQSQLEKYEVQTDLKSPFLSFRQQSRSKDISKGKDAKKDVNVIKDEIIVFLISMINDCYRINNTHIAQTVEQFLKDSLPQNASSNTLNYVKKRMNNYMQRQQQRQSITQRDTRALSRALSFQFPGQNISMIIPNLNQKLSYYLSPSPSNTMKSNVLSFPLCVKVMSSIILKTVHELSSQLLLYSELKTYFVQGLDMNISSYVYNKQPAKLDHSPMEVIKASILDFLRFVQQYLVEDYMHALVYVLIFKLCIRYWIFLRDYHEYRSKFFVNGSSTSQKQKKDQSGRESVVVDEESRVMGLWERDLKQIKSLYSEITQQLLVYTDESSESMSMKYKLAAVSLLKKLSFSIMSALTNEWKGMDALHRFLSHNFGINCPLRVNSESPADSADYYQRLEKFYAQESAFTHFTPVVISDETSDNIDIISGFGRADSDSCAPRCHIVINQLACVQVKRFRSIFMKIYLQKDVFELPLQENNGGVVGWGDNVRIGGVIMSLAKELKIEVYGFRIRPWKTMRQRLIGTVVVDLGDIIRSSQQESNNTALTAKLASSSRPSEVGRPSVSSFMEGSVKPGYSFSMYTNNPANALLDAAYSRSGVLGPASPGSLMESKEASEEVQEDPSVLCSHTAWYALSPSANYEYRVLRQNNQAAASKDGAKERSGTGKVGYIDSLAGVLAASKGPRTDTPLPQLRLHIQVNKLQ